jgi:hypothetical protein
MFLLIGNMLSHLASYQLIKIVFFLVLKVTKKSDLSDFYSTLEKMLHLVQKTYIVAKEARETREAS